MFADDTVGIAFYYLRGLPFWITLSVIMTKWVVALFVIFYGTGSIMKWLRRSPRFNFFEERFLELREKISWRWYNQRQKKARTGVIRWLAEGKNWIIIVLSFFPVSFVGIATIIATRAMKIKYGLLFLLLATVFKAVLLCFIFYYLTPPR